MNPIYESHERLLAAGAYTLHTEPAFSPWRRDTMREWIDELRFKGRVWALQPNGNALLIAEADRLETALAGAMA